MEKRSLPLLTTLPPPATTTPTPHHPLSPQGASTVLRAATAPELAGQSVLYMHAMQPAEPAAAARDERLAQHLWAYSCRQVGLSEAEDRDICWPNS